MNYRISLFSFLFSAGEEKIQMQKVRQLDIKNYFNNIYIVPSKDERSLSSTIAKIGLSPNQVWMIGNSLRSDILPAVNIGVHAILLTRGGWKYDTAIMKKDRNQNYFRVSTLNEATAIILGHLGNG